jgi:hypothetical protein
MTAQLDRCLLVFLVVALVLVISDQAVAFNPQPEPPGKWYVEGYIDMWVDAIDPTDTQTPFGLDPTIAGDAALDFSAGIIARFAAASDADGEPVDGLYDAEIEYFDLQIGDTSWDETPSSLQFQVFGGDVNACAGHFTVTMPEHPDLSFYLPTSPPTWDARDERGDVDLGVVAGHYELRDAIVPEPATACLLAVSTMALVGKRRTR